jgi:hypothetical protein
LSHSLHSTRKSHRVQQGCGVKKKIPHKRHRTPGIFTCFVHKQSGECVASSFCGGVRFYFLAKYTQTYNGAIIIDANTFTERMFRLSSTHRPVFALILTRKIVSRSTFFAFVDNRNFFDSLATEIATRDKLSKAPDDDTNKLD